MRRRWLTMFSSTALVLLSVNSTEGAAWKTCNDTPVRVKYPPMGISWDQCSIPPESPQELAFFSALGETRHYVLALGAGAGYKYILNGRCIIDHDNDRSDVALVKTEDIDGAAGLTMEEYDGCTFSWDEEHIVTADVMIADDLDFTRSDETAFLRNIPTGAKMGALSMVHELGHALGLKHSSAFAVMRDGGDKNPFVGMTPSSGGLGTEMTGDDVFGISQIYGFEPSYRNVFISSQMMLNGALSDNNLDKTRGNAAQPDPLNVCPGDVVNLFATVGNDGPGNEDVQVAVYASSDVNDYNDFSSGLAFFNATVFPRGTFSFPVFFTVPGSMPANVNESVFVSLPSTMLFDRKAYDNTSRSRLRIRRKAGC